MLVKEAMSSNVEIANPEQSIREAARLMADLDCGCLPVGEGGRLVGMITDRDIAVRAVAQGMSLKTPIRNVMSLDVKYCFEDAELDEVAQNMADIKVRRLPVVDQDKRLVGILSLGDVALTQEAACAAQCIERDFCPWWRPFAGGGRLRFPCHADSPIDALIPTGGQHADH
jgi:CBS domain-containing protein